jgi:hypothetical protein
MGLLSFFNRLSTNSELMQGMFSRLGVRDWFAENGGGPEALRRAALRCASCTDTQACATWLEGHATAEHTPSFCRNHDLVERIKRQTSSASTAA